MTIKIFTAIAIAASVLMMSSAAEAGNKRHGAHSGKSDQSATHNRRGNRRHNTGHKRRHGQHANRHYGYGEFYFGHDPYRACRFLKRKARRTGARYWWNQYRRCMNEAAYY